MKTTEHDPNIARKVRLARPSDLSFMLDLARPASNEIGFLPKPAIEKYIEWRNVNIALENDTPAGYLLCKYRQPDRPSVAQIHQAVVSYELRRRALGVQLVRRTIANAAVQGAGLIQLWCKGTLPANEFWHAAGFTAVGIRAGGKERNQAHILWRHQIIRAASLDAEPSNRRRNEPGKPLMRRTAEDTRAIMDAAQAGELNQLVAAWTARANVESIPQIMPLSAECPQLTIDRRPLPRPSAYAAHSIAGTSADITGATIFAVRATVGQLRASPRVSAE